MLPCRRFCAEKFAEDDEALARATCLIDDVSLVTFRSFKTLQDVVAAGLEVVDVVIQDEFTHDVLVRWNELYLVFDTT